MINIFKGIDKYSNSNRKNAIRKLFILVITYLGV